MIGRICCCLRLLWNLLKGFIEKTTYAIKLPKLWDSQLTDFQHMNCIWYDFFPAPSTWADVIIS